MSYWVDFVVSFLALLGSAVLTFGVDARLRRARTAKADLALDSEEVDQATRVIREEFSQTASGATTAKGGSGSSASTHAPMPAELEALAIMRVYSRDLMAEANRIAKRAGADRPSKKHVRLAGDRLGVVRDRAGVVSDLALALGAILIGAAASYQINLWTGGRAQEGMGLLMTLILAGGVGLTVAAVFLKWHKA